MPPRRAASPPTSPPTPGLGPPRLGRLGLLGAAAVFVVTAAVFLPTLGHGFVEWDDPATILNNLHIRGLGGEQLRWMFTTFFWGHYQPLLWLSYAVDYAWASAVWGDGLTPSAYHATSLLLHAVAAVLVFLLARRLLAAAGPRPAARLRRAGVSTAAPFVAAVSLTLAAAVAALLFSLHPLRAEPVAWVTGRGDVLAAVFLLTAALAWWRASERHGRGGYGPWLALAVALYALSLLTRAAGVMLPLVLVLLDWYPRRRLGGGPGRWLGRAARPVWLEKVPFAALAAAAAIVAPMAKAAAGSTVDLARHGSLERFAQACYAVLFYLWKTVAPAALSPIYELRLPMKVEEPRYLMAMAVVPLGLIGLMLLARRRPAVPLAVAVFLILLLPVLGVVQSGNQYAADRYTYLPAVGLMVLLAGGFRRLWGMGRGGAAVGAGLAVALVAAWGVLSVRQVGVWRSNETLWVHAAAVTPESSIARNGCGWVLLQAGRYDEALAHLRRAVELQPANEQAHHNIWIALTRQGRQDDLLQAYRDSIRVFPKFAEAHYSLGLELQRRGQEAEAVAAYRAAIGLRPAHSKALNNLGQLAQKQGNLEEASRRYREAVAADGGNLIARRNYARMLRHENRLSEAVAELEAALRVAPDDEPTLRLLAEWKTAGSPP